MGENSIGSASSASRDMMNAQRVQQQPTFQQSQYQSQSPTTVQQIQPVSVPPSQSRIAKPASLLLAMGVGAGATVGITKGIETGAFVSFFTGAAIKSIAALASYVGVSALLTAVSGFCYKKYSAQLNRINNGLEQHTQNTQNLPFKKMMAGLSFLGSTSALGLSIGSLVTAMTGGSDFGMSLIIGGAAGVVAGLLGLALMGWHNNAVTNSAKQIQQQNVAIQQNVVPPNMPTQQMAMA